MSPLTFYVASDLHYGHSRKGDSATRNLANYVNQHPTDALILAGDLGTNPSALRECLQLFSPFPGHKLAIPGNHDIWLDPAWNTACSWELHESHLPAFFQESGFHPLHIEPYTISEVHFVGSMGWYDYSFRDEIDVPYECYVTKTPPWAPMPIWSDARYAAWPFDDPTLTQNLAQRMLQHLDNISSENPIVAIVHHVVTKELLIHPRSIVPIQWRFANAFLGSERFADIIRSDPRITQVFCGHIHLEREAYVQQCLCTCLGGDYQQKQLILSTPQRILHKQMFTPSHPH